MPFESYPVNSQIKCALALLFSLTLVGTSGCSSFQKQEDYERPLIAIMPFENLSIEPKAGDQVSGIFFTQLQLEGRYNLVLRGDVKAFLGAQIPPIRRTGEISMKNAHLMHEQLGVDYILLGSVNEYTFTTVEDDEVPVTGISARLVHAPTGKVVWGGSQTRQGNDRESIFGIGRISSLSRLAHFTVEYMVHKLRRVKLVHGVTSNETKRTSNKERK